MTASLFRKAISTLPGHICIRNKGKANITTPLSTKTTKGSEGGFCISLALLSIMLILLVSREIYKWSFNIGFVCVVIGKCIRVICMWMGWVAGWPVIQ